MGDVVKEVKLDLNNNVGETITSVAKDIVSEVDNAVRENTAETAHKFIIVSDAPERPAVGNIVEIIANKIEEVTDA